MIFYYSVPFEDSAHPGDRNLIRGATKKEFNNIKVKDVLKTNLSPYYKNNDIGINVKEFLEDFSNLQKFQICYLSVDSRLPKNIIKEFHDTFSQKIISNICLIGKNPDSFSKWGNYNSSCIFFDLSLRKNGENVEMIWLIKRIEFLDIPYFEDGSPSEFKNINTKISFKNKWELDESYKSYTLYVTRLLHEMSPVVKIFNDDDTITDVNRLLTWKKVITNLKKIIDNEESNLCWIFNFHSINMEEMLNRPVYLFSKLDKINESSLKNFQYWEDESISFKVQVKLSENIDFIGKEILPRIDEINNENMNISKNISVLKENIEKIESKIDELEAKIEQLNNDIDVKNELYLEAKSEFDLSEQECIEFINQKQNLFDQLKKLKSDNAKDKGDEKSKNISSLSLKIERLEKSIKEKELLLKQQENKLLDFKRNLDILNGDMKKYHQFLNAAISDKEEYEIQKNKLENKRKNNIETIENYEILQDSIDRNNFFVKKAKISIDSKDEDNVNWDNFNFEQEPYYDLRDYSNCKNWKLSILSEDNSGLRAKINRYDNAMKNVRNGNYRNPYMVYSINSTPDIEIINDLSTEIIERYNLNKKQIDVVQKSISTRDCFYLQGPPGTGKTQTISAITNILTDENKNVLMTSSTHEAINNFFDRLNDLSSNDPNIILLKYDSNKKKENDYTEEKLYSNFLNRINNFILEKTINSNDKEETVKNINILINKYPSMEGSKTFISFKMLDNIKTKIINSESFVKENFTDFENGILNDICKNYGYDNFESFRKEYQSNEDIGFCFSKYYQKISRLFFENHNVSNEDDKELLKKIFDEYKVIDGTLSLVEIKNNFQQNGKSKIMNKLQNYLANQNDDDKNKNEFKFKEFVFNNNYINVVGITTTSRTEVNICNKTKNLFLEYPIDTVIIDEISKSTTPEILARTILAKKVIFAGDYKQLPPVNEIDEAFIDKILKNGKFDDFYKSFIGKNAINNIYNDEKSQKKFLEDEFKKLYELSFFANQVKKIKEKKDYSISKRAYDSLKVQHRFTNEIMDIVNINYDDDEKLQMPSKHNEFKKYGFKWKDVIYDNDDVILIDTSRFDSSYSNLLNNLKIRGNLDNSFDQNDLFVIKNGNTKSNGLFNEYNAFVCLDICLSLFESNDDLKEKIGIICVTSNQKNIIRNLIKTNEKYKILKQLNIKVDTIDNFQGREKEIIIVDFVRSKNKFDGNRINEPSKRNLDFNSSRERNNVALSRAKNKLFLVGSFEYYSKTHGYDISELSKQYLYKIKRQIRMWEQ